MYVDLRPIGDKDIWEQVQPRKEGRFYGFGTSFDQGFTMMGTSPICIASGDPMYLYRSWRYVYGITVHLKIVSLYTFH